MTAHDDAARVRAALVRLGALHPRSIVPGLERISRVLDALGRPQDRLPKTFHVAGTNGKGSTVTVLAAIAEATGLKAHVYTSPHLVRFNERIRLAGNVVEDAPLADALERVEAANAGAQLTFFEATTAAAFLLFAETPADVCMIEVGLGGRFDATNVIDAPACAVVTPVGFDHQEFLGDTLGAIAGEKAGIIKPGCPVVIGPQETEARAALVAEAQRVGAPALVWGTDFSARIDHGRVTLAYGAGEADLAAPGLAGPHQVENAGVAAMAAIAAGLVAGPEGDAALSEGVANARIAGRLQQLAPGLLTGLAHPAQESRRDPGEVWIDGAHNPQAAAALALALGEMEARAPRPLVLVLSLQEDKDAAAFLAPFAGLVRGVCATAYAAGRRPALAPHLLAEAAQRADIDAVADATLSAALREVSGWVDPDEPRPRVVIAGSLYLIGEALALDQGALRDVTPG